MPLTVFMRGLLHRVPGSQRGRKQAHPATGTNLGVHCSPHESLLLTVLGFRQPSAPHVGKQANVRFTSASARGATRPTSSCQRRFQILPTCSSVAVVINLGLSAFPPLFSLLPPSLSSKFLDKRKIIQCSWKNQSFQGPSQPLGLLG